ncbi:DUF2163 domain-containing protein [Henriciella mobilis]|uniref:DUF2163 domain-containing protein n=1 Tax=Henriciella mobilis TaxID=2305467 RepID=A0A399RF37_9PROT|nr:DUF2163 domain-containing protein [Henriciella mobilis]RIJ28495.1 DUF2163 domain-containing protein [Henriciella mobilis]
MRLIDEAFRDRLGQTVLTTCLCWKLSRADGLTVCLTEHDEPVVWKDETYQPGAAIEGGRFDLAGGLKPGRASGTGALAADVISEADLAAGLWNGARVHVYRVDWRAPDLGALVWTGYLSEISHRETGFEAELVSLKADLERPVGRTYSRLCDARLGDARCGLAGVGGQSCDKRFETCRDVFSNVSNFRGFPHMPGPDALLAGPGANGNDGGKR